MVFNFCIATRSIATGRCSQKKIRQPTQKRLPSALADAQVRDLLGRIRNPTYKTCCAVIYACGLRTTEATALEIGAIDRTNLHLRIIGKGNKERFVPLPQPILEDLRRLWKIRRNPRWLFPHQAGTEPIGRGALAGAFSAAAWEGRYQPDLAANSPS